MPDDGKVRRSVTIDKDLNEAIKDHPGFNVSGAVNEYLRQRLLHDRTHREVVRDHRERELKAKQKAAQREAEAAEARAERLGYELETLDEDADDDGGLDDDQIFAIDGFVDMVENGDFPRANLEPTNDAVETQADDVNMDPGRFVTEVEARL